MVRDLVFKPKATSVSVTIDHNMRHHGVFALILATVFTLVVGCGTPPPPLAPVNLPVVSWVCSVKALPADLPEVCRVQFTIMRRDIYPDTVHVVSMSPVLETLWGQPTQLRMYNPELTGAVDSAYALERSLPGYDPSETEGFSCYALPVQHHDGRCELESYIRIKRHGQIVFETRQTISIKPEEQ